MSILIIGVFESNMRKILRLEISIIECSEVNIGRENGKFNITSTVISLRKLNVEDLECRSCSCLVSMSDSLLEAPLLLLFEFNDRSIVKCSEIDGDLVVIEIRNIDDTLNASKKLVDVSGNCLDLRVELLLELIYKTLSII